MIQSDSIRVLCRRGVFPKLQEFSYKADHRERKRGRKKNKMLHQ